MSEHDDTAARTTCGSCGPKLDVGAQRATMSGAREDRRALFDGVTRVSACDQRASRRCPRRRQARPPMRGRLRPEDRPAGPKIPVARRRWRRRGRVRCRRRRDPAARKACAARRSPPRRAPRVLCARRGPAPPAPAAARWRPTAASVARPVEGTRAELAAAAERLARTARVRRSESASVAYASSRRSPPSATPSPAAAVVVRGVAASSAGARRHTGREAPALCNCRSVWKVAAASSCSAPSARRGRRPAASA